MTEVEFRSIDISGYSKQIIPNRFLRQSNRTGGLAVIYPGLHYSCDRPLLHYTAQLLINHGLDVLQLNTDYTKPEFQEMPEEDRRHQIYVDSLAAVESGLAQEQYTRLVLVGKSIGTIPLAYMAARDFTQATSLIWFTPLLHKPELVQAAARTRHRSMYIAGNNDPIVDPRALELIHRSRSAHVHIMVDADHSLEIPGDVHASILTLGVVMKIIDRFLSIPF